MRRTHHLILDLPLRKKNRKLQRLNTGFNHIYGFVIPVIEKVDLEFAPRGSKTPPTFWSNPQRGSALPLCPGYLQLAEVCGDYTRWSLLLVALGGAVLLGLLLHYRRQPAAITNPAAADRSGGSGPLTALAPGVFGHLVTGLPPAMDPRHREHPCYRLVRDSEEIARSTPGKGPVYTLHRQGGLDHGTAQQLQLRSD